MPTKLPSGLTIYNATAHTLVFFDEDWKEPVEVKSDKLLDLRIQTDVKVRADQYNLVEVEYMATTTGLNQLAWIKENYPDALIVASNVAARTYGRPVVCPIPHPKSERWSSKKLNRSNRFNVYTLGEENNGNSN